jgi:LPXTG-motif cell wall-anchored protein
MGARRLVLAMAVVPVAMAAAFPGGAADAAQPKVLRVGTWNGIKGQYTSIQAAVDAARAGDWILVGPGDYREQGVPGSEHRAGVLITTPNLHLRGMDRNTVIVDGTRAGAPQPCDSAPSSQDFGASDGSGGTLGRNGVEVWEADGVSIENMVVCNYLSGSGGGEGNEIWWNGGDGGGTINLHSLHGDYLTASSSYNYGTDPANHGSTTVPMGKYGIFTSNESGPGVIDHSYASNMGDSAYYIGACPDCNVTLTHAHAQNSALGFSGTNAGGHLVIENGEWDQNKTGIAPNTLNNDDWPSPANGACPGGAGSCSVIRGNNVHDNNNQNAPAYGIAGSAPPGTGIILSGIRNFTVTGNTVTNNNAWGVVVNDFPDTSSPPAKVTTPCAGGIDASTPAQPLCYYQAFGNEVAGNTFTNNGNGWAPNPGNPGNADIALAALPSAPNNGNCFHDNTDTSGTLSSDPPQIQTLYGTCGIPNGGYLGPSFVQLVCSTPGALSFGPISPSCSVPVVSSYPPVTGVTILPIPFNQPTMPNPCAGVPKNPWCSGGALVPASTGATAAGLPDTGASPAASAAAVALAGGATLAGLVALRRRRRVA